MLVGQCVMNGGKQMMSKQRIRTIFHTLQTHVRVVVVVYLYCAQRDEAEYKRIARLLPGRG